MTRIPDAWMLHPVLAMALLTFVVGLLMLRRRIAEMRRRRVAPQSVATSAQMAARLEDTRASDNFRNLFEMPVLFYAGMLLAYAAHLASPAYLALSWAYVVARATHSAIHCTSNRLMHRFPVFLASFWLLVALWALIAWDLLVTGKG